TKDCPTTGVREETVERALIDELKAITFNDLELGNLKTLAISLRDEWTAKRLEEQNSVELSTNRVEERLVRLTDAYLDGMLEGELFEDRKRALLLERQHLRERSAQLKSSAGSPVARLLEFLELAKSASLSYETGNLDEKRNLLKSVTSNLIV